MKNSKLYFHLAGLGFLISSWSCQTNSSKPVNEVSEPKTEVPAVSYPALGNQDLMKLYSQADHVDIIFYHLPISVNQDDEPSVKNTVLYVSPAQPLITKTCQPVGRLSWMDDGVIIREADVYAEEGCAYLLFMESNQPVAANAMSTEGLQFFTNIISQVAKQKK